MSIKTAILFLTVIFFSFGYAQDANRVETYTPIFHQNINIDAFNSIGFSNITNSQISEIGSANPASLAKFSSMSSGIQFQYNTAMNYYIDLNLERAKQWLPSSIGFVYPVNNLTFGLSYHQKYSSFLDFGKIEITTVQQPDGTGEFLEAFREIVVHSPSVLFSYSVPDLFSNGDHFVIGGQLFWNFWEMEEKIFKMKATLDANDFSLKTGFIYNFNKKLSIGLFYEKGIDMEGELVFDSGLQIAVPFDTTGFVRAEKIKYLTRFELPDKVAFGLTSNISENVILSATFAEILWNSINTEIKNQVEFSANVLYSYSEMYDFTFGLFVTDREIKEQDLFNFNIPQNATYFDLGVKVKIDNLHLYAEVLDSHLISVDVREHTILKLGCNFTINN